MIYSDQRKTAKASAPAAPTVMHVSIYCRISLDAAAEGLGVERQERECREYAAQQGWIVDHVYVDNSISATTGKVRPQFEAMLTAAPAHLLVWHTDRAVRLTRDLDRIIDAGIFVHAVTAGHLDLSTPAGVATAKTITAWAEYEGKQKALRQKASHRQRAESGKTWWHVARPFGWETDGAMRGPEHDALRECFKIVREGGTYASAARWLTAQGFTTSKGHHWNGSKLARTMRMPHMAGLIAHNGAIVGQGSWVPVVSEEEWTAVTGGVERHTARPASKPNTSGADKRVRSLLGGMGNCGAVLDDGTTCADPLRQTNQGAKRTRVYQPACHHVAINADWLDDHVTKVVLRELAKPGRMIQDGPAPTEADAAEAAAKAIELRAKLEAFTNLEAVMPLSTDQIAERDRMQTELDAVTGTAQDYYSASPLDRVYSPGELVAAWKSENLSLQHRREAVSKIVETLTIRPRLNRNERANPDMVTMTLRK